MSAQPDRRRFPRVPASQPLHYAFGRLHGIGRLSDISLGGIGFFALHPKLRKGIQTRVHFELNAKPIETDVVVCHMQPGQRFGGYFVKLDQQQRAAVQTFTSASAGQS